MSHVASEEPSRRDDVADGEELATRLVAEIRSYESVGVAYSGGVDSAVVAKAAVFALGARAVAITAVSPSLAIAERELARSEAKAIGIRHMEISTSEFDRPEYRANAGDRCFFCKETLYRLAEAKLAELDIRCLVNGTNVDDLGDYRPGLQAARDYHVRSPLVDLGIGKAQVRQLARFWHLNVADKPASPCLSSRIAYGVEVTEERVRRVELAEAFIRRLTGLQELRVRHEADELARIEVPLQTIPSLVQDSVRESIAEEFRRLGFRRTTIDLDGFRSGSLNDALQLVTLGMASDEL